MCAVNDHTQMIKQFNEEIGCLEAAHVNKVSELIKKYIKEAIRKEAITYETS